MKLEVLFFVICSVFIVNASQNGDKNIEFEEVSSADTTTINTIIKKMNEKMKKVDDTETSVGSGDDDGDISGSGDQGSGDGSGDPNAVIVTMKPTKNKEDTTPVVINITLVTKKPTTKEMSTMGNTVEEEDDDGDKVIVDPEPSQTLQPTQKSTGVDKKSGINFTLGIIIGVVVGAILAILIIVFLVYRLRKKDEGSYSLDEQSSTAYLRADTDSPTKGKEYFA